MLVDTLYIPARIGVCYPGATRPLTLLVYLSKFEVSARPDYEWSTDPDSDNHTYGEVAKPKLPLESMGHGNCRHTSPENNDLWPRHGFALGKVLISDYSKELRVANMYAACV